MSSSNELAFRPSDWFESGSASNAAATATRAAPPALAVGGVGGGRRHVVTGILLTMSGAPTAGGAITVSGALASASGGPSSTTLHTIVAGAAPSPLFLPVRLVCDPQVAVSVALPALGVGITGSVTVFGYTTSA